MNQFSENPYEPPETIVMAELVKPRRKVSWIGVVAIVLSAIPIADGISVLVIYGPISRSLIPLGFGLAMLIAASTFLTRAAASR